MMRKIQERRREGDRKSGKEKGAEWRKGREYNRVGEEERERGNKAERLKTIKLSLGKSERGDSEDIILRKVKMPYVYFKFRFLTIFGFFCQIFLQND
jgi:hypothetical protein